MHTLKHYIDGRPMDTGRLLVAGDAGIGEVATAAMAGDRTASRTAYQDFFAVWKDTDPDVPILVQARREYEQRK